MPEAEFLGGALDGCWMPMPMTDGSPAAVVEVDMPPVFDSALDSAPAVPARTYRYQFVVEMGARSRVVYEYRGEVSHPAERPWEAHLRRGQRRWSSPVPAWLRALAKLRDNPVTEEMRDAAISTLAQRLARTVDEIRAHLDRLASEGWPERDQ